MPKCGGSSVMVDRWCTVRWRCTYQKTRRCRVDIAGTQRGNIIECICVEGAAPRGEEGRRPTLPWILMVRDIAFASIYPLLCTSGTRIINVVIEQKGIYSRRQYVPSLSRSIPKKENIDDLFSRRKKKKKEKKRKPSAFSIFVSVPFSSRPFSDFPRPAR